MLTAILGLETRSGGQRTSFQQPRPRRHLAAEMHLAGLAFTNTQKHRETGEFMATPTKEIKKELPQPNSDFYQLLETLPADELVVLKQVRAFMETKVAPIITKYWVEDSFPF